jgi:hypothetical protein
MLPTPGTRTRPPRSGFVQVGFQHGHNTYLGLLGAPPVKDSLLPELTAEAIGPIMQRPKIEKGKVPPMVAPRRKAG